LSNQKFWEINSQSWELAHFGRSQVPSSYMYISHTHLCRKVNGTKERRDFHRIKQNFAQTHTNNYGKQIKRKVNPAEKK